MNGRHLTFALLMLPLVAACGSARIVHGHRHGGEVELTGAYMSGLPEARALMAEHCDGPFAVHGPGSDDDAPVLLDVPARGQGTARFLCLDWGDEFPVRVAKGRR